MYPDKQTAISENPESNIITYKDNNGNTSYIVRMAETPVINSHDSLTNMFSSNVLNKSIPSYQAQFNEGNIRAVNTDQSGMVKIQYTDASYVPLYPRATYENPAHDADIVKTHSGLEYYVGDRRLDMSAAGQPVSNTIARQETVNMIAKQTGIQPTDYAYSRDTKGAEYLQFRDQQGIQYTMVQKADFKNTPIKAPESDNGTAYTMRMPRSSSHMPPSSPRFVDNMTTTKEQWQKARQKNADFGAQVLKAKGGEGEAVHAG